MMILEYGSAILLDEKGNKLLGVMYSEKMDK